MSRKDKLIKSKSIYTLRSKHTSVTNGTIFENDHVTIIPNDGIYDEDMPLFSESNFKFRIGRGNEERKKHSRSNWIANDDNYVWTLGNIPHVEQTTEGKIVLRPNYTSLKDFVYYGSAVELLRATMNDIIMRYPGGISYYRSEIAPEVTVPNDSNRYYLVSNEFNIDYWTPAGMAEDEVENPLRILSISYMNYEDRNGNDIGLDVCITGNCLNSIIGRVTFRNNNGRPQGRGAGDTDLLYGKGGLGEVEGMDEPFYWTEMTVMCYSGVSEYNFLPNVPMKDVNIELIAEDSNGNRSDVYRCVTDATGKCVVPRKMLGKLGDCVNWFEATGTTVCKDKETTVSFGTLQYNCYKANSAPVVNLYISCKESHPENYFPYIAYAKSSSDGTPLTDVEITFYARLTYDETIQGGSLPTGAVKPFYNGPMSTNPNGYAQLNETESWYYSGDHHQYIIKDYYIVDWYAKAVRNGVELTSPTLNGYETGYTFYFDVEDPAKFNLITVNGIVGTNTSVGSGCEARIIIYDEKDNALPYTGYTDNSGSFSLDYETYSMLYKNTTPASYNCSIKYDGVLKEGIRTNFVPNNKYYSQTLYFTGGTQQTGYTLTGYVYSQRNGAVNPVANQLVVFSATTSKDVLFTAEVLTNENGVATVQVPGGNWNSQYPNSIWDLVKWKIYTNYNGSQVFGVNGVNYLNNHQYSDIIYVKGSDNWTALSVHVQGTYPTNNGSYNLEGAFVVVCGSTLSNGTWNYKRTGVTDANGNVTFPNDNNWIHINGTPNGDVNDFINWTCYGSYGGNYVYGNVLDISQPHQELVIKTAYPPTPPGPPSTSCDKISVPEGFYIYLDGDGKKHLLTTVGGQNSHSGQVVIKPKSAYTESFWNTLDDFEAVILNRNTNPIFKARFETPYIENNIHLYKMKNYVFPTVDEIGTPDLTTGNFNGYLSSLMQIAEYYDEYEADNLWRMMTHDSIKNLDWSFSRRRDGSEDDIDDFDYSRMKAALRVEARIYDDIKRYADNIKSMNYISYDGRNNVPDYFLSDLVELNGFEPKNIDTFSQETTDTIYSGTRSRGYNGAEVSSEFMRRLCLSSKYIMSMKGTRRGIEALLGMFGYEYGDDKDYTIEEYIGIASQFPKYLETTSLRSLGINEYLNTDDIDNFMIGYPVEVICPGINNPTEADYYLVPWVQNGGNYINDIYFQEKGGWQRMDKKDINLGITTATEIEESFGLNIYGETEPYMYYANNIDELISIPNSKVFENMVCYVTDISDLYTRYKTEEDYQNSGEIIISHEEEEQIAQGGTVLSRGASSNESTEVNVAQPSHTVQPAINVQPDPNKAYSHYFVLKNTALSNYVGFVHTELYNCYGWKNVLLGEFKNGPTTQDGLRVLYLESLELNNKGNNPHCGFGNYDEGIEYINKLNFLFGAAIATGEYDYLKDGNESEQASYQELFGVGFGIKTDYVDNKKCHYFEKDGGEIIFGKSSEPSQGGYEVYTSSLHFISAEGDNSDVPINTGEYNNFHNPEPNSDSVTEESAAYSIVNVKNLLITFNTHGNAFFKKYLENIVFKYLNEMIPSTTILRYKFNDGGLVHLSPMPVDTTRSNGDVDVIVGDAATVATNDGETIYFIENNDGLVNNSNNTER